MPLPNFADNDAPPFLQQLDRTQHATSSGIEIVKTFYVEPYAKHQKLIKILQGSIDDDGKRELPTRDTYIKNCYCNETEVNFADAEVMASSHDMAEDEKGDSVDELIDQLQDTEEHPAEGGCGAIVKAHYRPLITAYKSDDDDDPDDEAFDWLDPTYDPGLIQMPWPDGIYINAIKFGLLGNQLATEAVPDEVANPVSISTTIITIRRLLVARPPWQAIQQCKNAINQTDFPAGPHRATYQPDPNNNHGRKVNPGGIPNSPPGTLKFLDADVRNMMDSEGKRWFEIVYTFEKIEHYTDRLYNFDGKQVDGWVTWNHILIHPHWFASSPIGWYMTQLGENQRFAGITVPGWFGVDLTGGHIHPTANFIKLFDNDAK